MLRFMRKYAAGWMIKIIFGLIIIVFIFWGVGGMQGEGEKTVAEVGSHKVSRVEYEEAYKRLVEMYKNIFKDKFDENMAKTLKLREAAMNDLVDRYLLIQKARELGMTVSDKEFRDRLETVDAFKKDGKFNKKVYQEVLKLNGIEPGKFEQSEKMAMLSGKMTALIRDNGVILSEPQVWNAYVKEKGKIDLAYMVFDPSDYMKKVTVTDKETEDAYEKEKTTHVSENRYRLKYITIMDKGPVKDDAAYMELLKAKDIDRYGKEKGFTVTDMGPMTEQEALQKLKSLKPNEWLKGLKKGDISLPIRADGRSFIFQLVDFEAGKPIDKATVLKEIRERIIREKAKAMAKAEAQTVITGKSFASKKDTGFLARNAVSISAIGMIPKEEYGVMALSKAHEVYGKPVEIGGKYYLFSLKDEKAPDKEEWEKDKGPFKQYMMRKNEEDFFKSFMTDLKKSSKVKINWKEIAVNQSEG
jgi:peptidyl-prolyl cis-trans isomerase D